MIAGISRENSAETGCPRPILKYSFRDFFLKIFVSRWCYVVESRIEEDAWGGWLPVWGVFYGDTFGYSMPRCRAFPFSLFRHPQYISAVGSIWGFFIAIRFPL